MDFNVGFYHKNRVWILTCREQEIPHLYRWWMNCDKHGIYLYVTLRQEGRVIITDNSKELKRKIVRAPSDTLYSFPSGRMMIGHNMFTNTGRWIGYHHQKRKRRDYET